MPLDEFGLGPDQSFTEISYEDFYDILRKYGPTLPTNDVYENFEDVRLRTIPDTIQQRKAAGCAFIEKVELQILGEYRRKQPPGLLIKPQAASLAMNTIEAVREVSREAFFLYGDRRNYTDAISKLMELKGVSFAIATLILHELDPTNMSYFTEGLYRWVRADEAKDGGWDRKIEYNLRQYKVLLEKTAQLRSRLRRDSGVDVSALEVEQVARELTSWATARRKRSRNEEEDFLLQPIDKQPVRKLGPPKTDDRERQAMLSTPDNQTADSAISPNVRNIATELPAPDTLPKVPPVPYLKPGFKSSWPGHLRTACEYCRKAKRACKHKDDPLSAPPLKAIGRPRKHPLPNGGTPNPATEHAISAPQGHHIPATRYPPIMADRPAAAPAIQQTPTPAIEQAVSGLTTLPADASTQPAFPLPDPHAAMREALAAFQKQV